MGCFGRRLGKANLSTFIECRINADLQSRPIKKGPPARLGAERPDRELVSIIGIPLDAQGLCFSAVVLGLIWCPNLPFFRIGPLRFLTQCQVHLRKCVRRCPSYGVATRNTQHWWVHPCGASSTRHREPERQVPGEAQIPEATVWGQTKTRLEGFWFRFVVSCRCMSSGC